MKNILLLHGAAGSRENMQSLERSLSPDFAVESINFYGHGGTPYHSEFSIELFAKQVLDWMQSAALDFVTIIGYSLGGYVGLYLAKNYPDKVEKLVTLGTKLYWDVSVADKEIAKLDPETIEAKVPAFAQALEKLHSPVNWKTVLRQTASMLKDLGKFSPMRLTDFRSIQIPVLLIVGDRDRLVTMVETSTAFRELPKGQLAVMPSTPHAIEQTDVVLAASLIKKFLNQ